MEPFGAALDFHRAIGHPTRFEPYRPTDEEIHLRLNLICAEFGELICVMVGTPADSDAARAIKDNLRRWAEAMFTIRVKPSWTAIARQIADLHIVLSGTSLTYGIPEAEVIQVVHEANMRKLGGPKRRDGKQLPPNGWVGPDEAIREVLAR